MLYDLGPQHPCPDNTQPSKIEAGGCRKACEKDSFSSGPKRGTFRNHSLGMDNLVSHINN